MSYIGRQNLGGAYRQLDDISSGFDGSDTTHTLMSTQSIPVIVVFWCVRYRLCVRLYQVVDPVICRTNLQMPVDIHSDI